MGAARRPDRGLVLVYVSILGLLMGVVFVLASRGILDATKVDRFHNRRVERDETVVRAGAVALELLATGLPPSDPYACIISVTGESTTHDLRVDYTSVVYPHTWDIDVVQADADDLATLPTAPSTF